jgi:hypothetical protein
LADVELAALKQLTGMVATSRSDDHEYLVSYLGDDFFVLVIVDAMG